MSGIALLRPTPMSDLSGCFILVVDDELLVALDIAQCLQSEGASVVVVRAWTHKTAIGDC
jgi:CheY-like chemotaxis protein